MPERLRSRRASISLLALVLSLGLVAAACSSGSPDAPGDGQEPTDAASAGEITLMTFNVEYGGKLTSFDAVIEAIEASGAEVVGINEAEGSTAEIAEELGWPYYDARRAIVSQLPLLEPPDPEAVYTFAELAPGNAIAVTNVHLTSSPYGANLITNKGADLEEVLETEQRVRVSEIEPILESMGTVPDAMPRFVIGDMNSPSHHDYTEEMVGERPQIQFPIEWPVPIAIEGAGYTDSFRTLHPDPKTDPGLTWPAWRPKVKDGYNPPKDANEDRIDYVFAAGPVEPLDSWIMGEEGAEGVTESVTPWPTDHRAVISTFELTGEPVPPPDLVAVQSQILEVGEPLEVRFSDSTGTASEVTVTQAPEAGAEAEQAGVEGTAGEVSFDTTGWQPVEHGVRLMGGSQMLASTTVYLVEPGSEPRLELDKRVYRVNEPIMAEWYGAPGNRWDWLGVYDRGANPNVAWYKTWTYTGATVAGEAELSGKAKGKWPLEPGKYSVYLLVDDGYEVVAQAEFEVKGK